MRPKIFMFIILLAFFLLGCSQEASKPKNNEKKDPPEQQAPKASSDTESWNKLIENARKEGELILITIQGSNVIEALRKEWTEQGFNINLKMMTMNGSQLAQKLNSERKSGIFAVDALLHGGETLTNSVKSIGALDPIEESSLILPEVKDPAKWYGNKLPYVDKDKTMMYASLYPEAPVTLNTNLISKDEIKSYSDLLKPQYKGKILLNDVRLPGSATKWFHAMLLKPGILDEAYFEKLKEQIGPIIADQALQVQWVAQGKYPIGLGLRGLDVSKLQDAGAPLIKMAPEEGTYLTSASSLVGLVNKAPHPNSAKLFLNWFLSRKTQTVWAPTTDLQSARLDVPTTGIPPDVIRKEGAKYVPAVSEEFLLEGAQYMRLGERIFGSLK